MFLTSCLVSIYICVQHRPCFVLLSENDKLPHAAPKTCAALTVNELRTQSLCSHLSGCLSLCLSPSAIYDSVSPQACRCTQRCSVITSWCTAAKHLLMDVCGVTYSMCVCVCLSNVNMNFHPHASVQKDKHTFISDSMCYL